MSEQISDAEFCRKLKDFLDIFLDGGIVVTFKNQDGSINREKTLALPCYEGFTP